MASVPEVAVAGESDANGTDRTQVEALRERQRQDRLLFQENPQPMWIYDVETLAFLGVNTAAEAMYGYSREEFLARTILDIRPQEDVERVRTSAHEAPDTIKRSGPWRHLRKDGSLLFARLSSHPTLYEGRRARLVLATDVTAEKELEAQLAQSQKMEAVGQLAGGVAHDFNNLLTVINGYAQLLLARLHESDPLRADAASILQAGERAAALTQQLLAFSRRQVLQPRPLDVGRVVEHLRPMLDRLLRADIVLQTVLPDALPAVMADPVQLEQVLVNLAINASDAMPSGGTLTFGASTIDVDAETAARHDLAAGAFVALTVVDTGIGMDEETLRRIFEPFFTTKGKGRSSGLGLPVAYGIIRQSGGHLAVRTAPDRGTTFTIYLPQSDRPAATDVASGYADARTADGQGTVLVVEDHEAVRRLAADVLRAHGYDVLAAAHGDEAVALAAASGARVDLLLTDVVMPRMSGREVADTLRRQQPGLAVLYMSGYTADAIGQDAALDAGRHHLAKPFTPTELVQRVREVLAAHQQDSSEGGGDAMTPHAHDSKSHPTPTAGRRIVVADDEPGLRLLLAATLAGAGYEVRQATNGLEALRLCGEQHVDLLLTDLVMPDHEGLETIRRMRQEQPDVPVVAMSGAFDGGFLDVARAMGASAVLAKPFTPDQVLETVRAVLGD